MTQTNYSPGTIVFTLHASVRCGHHPQPLHYKHRLADNTYNLCQATLHTTKHIMEDYVVLAPFRQEHNIIDVRDLWVAPGRLISYLRAAGLFEQN